MKRMRGQWVHGRFVVACIASLSAGGAVAAGAQAVTGRAYGAYVSTPLAGQVQSPLAVLPAISEPNGDITSASAEALTVPNTLSSDFLNSSTTGAVGTAARTAQSTASVGHLNILGGLITAQDIIANTTSSRGAGGATSNANGSTFEGLVVAGTPITAGDAPVAPNTRIPLPNVGYVILNEQTRTGDGMTGSGMTVNMIHVVLQQAVAGALGQIIGYRQVGEIIVASATSAVGF